jgi:predicted metal-dependent hydrolase
MRKRSTPAKKRKPAGRKTGKRPGKRHSLAPAGAVQRQFEFSTEGLHFDLQEIFDRINARYFRNRLRDYTITWGRRRRRRPTTYIVFGSIQEEDRIIRIHPLLDREFVPRWYIEYVVYHEMLHAFVPDRYDPAGRRIIHHDGFLKRERKFRFYQAAMQWERDNLGRFLR